MNGVVGRDRKIFYLIDYGMTRSFIDKKEKNSLRRQRQNCLFRGTFRYCSLNVHKRLDQGRVDDLWALIFTMTELFAGLPWNQLKNEEEIRRQKETLRDEEIYVECPKCFQQMAAHLKKLRYEDRPDYSLLYKLMMDELKEGNFSFLDPYDWETNNEEEEAVQTAVEWSQQEKWTRKPDDDDYEFRLFPNVAPKAFEEKILPI